MEPIGRTWIKRFATILMMLLVVGCGSPETTSESDNSASQASPSEGSNSSADSASSITLPDATDPAPAGSGSKTGSSTMELPTDIAPADAPPSGSAAEGGDFELPEIDRSSKNDASIELKYATWNAIHERARSTGKITVVDLWSTMCAPCIKEFPGLVRLDETLRDKVTCIGVDVDFDGRKKHPPESYEQTVQAFLTSVDAKFENYICQTPSDDVFQEAGLPSIPAVLVFNADGELVKQFIDAGETLGFTYEKDVIPLVNSIL